MMIVFHHCDADGRCAAAIVKRWFFSVNRPAEERAGIHMVEIDYKNRVPVEKIQPNDTVVIVDFSFKPDDMAAAQDRTKMGIVWCDHHKTAKAYGYNVPGERDFNEKGLCGAELTYKFFFPRNVKPHWLDLLGDYDSWRMQHEDECLPFYEGLKLWNQSPKDGVWDLLFDEDSLWQKIVEEGKISVEYRDNYCDDICNSFGYETTIGGQRAYAANIYRFGSQGFGERVDKYPVCIAYIHDGKGYTVSLYSETVDVSLIAKQYGGGGHKGAAGFVCDKLPFNKD